MKLEDLEALLAAATLPPWTPSDVECRTHEDDAAIVALMNAAPALLRVAKAAVVLVKNGCLDPGYGYDAALIAAVSALEVDDG